MLSVLVASTHWDWARAKCPHSQRARKVPGQSLSIADLQQLQRGLDTVRIFCFAVRLNVTLTLWALLA